MLASSVNVTRACAQRRWYRIFQRRAFQVGGECALQYSGTCASQDNLFCQHLTRKPPLSTRRTSTTRHQHENIKKTALVNNSQVLLVPRLSERNHVGFLQAHIIEIFEDSTGIDFL